MSEPREDYLAGRELGKRMVAARSARQEKVREALVQLVRLPSTMKTPELQELHAAALAEVEEWETRLADYGERIDRWRDGDEYRRLYARAEAAEARLAQATKSVGYLNRRIEAAEAKRDRLRERNAEARNHITAVQISYPKSDEVFGRLELALAALGEQT